MSTSSPKKKTTLPFIPAWFDDFPLNLFEFRVYCTIRRRSDNKRVKPCYQSVPNMAKHLRMDVKTVRKSIRALLVHKLILSTPRTGQSTLYEPNPYHPTVGVEQGNPSRQTVGDPYHGTVGHPYRRTVGKGNPSEGSPTKGGKPPGNCKKGIGAALLLKDKDRIRKAISEENEKHNPDQDLLAAYRAELQEINDALRARGKQAKRTGAKQATDTGPSNDRNAGTYNEGRAGDYAMHIVKEIQARRDKEAQAAPEPAKEPEPEQPEPAAMPSTGKKWSQCISE